jgi:MOSC domain-containing protein YiiM
MDYPTSETLEAGLADVRRSPRETGTLELIVRRPAEGERETLETGELSLESGLVGDTWNIRGSRRSADGGPHPDRQLNLMNARAAALVAGTPERRALAGDQLYVDLDLTEANLPAGTRLALGTAVIEVTDQPHTGCAQFRQRFGPDASRFVNSDAGRELRLRGINARVVVAGTITRGDTVTKVRPGA